MKHKIKKWTSYSAGCSRLGCIVGLEGGMVEGMSIKSLHEFFPSECPVTMRFDKKHVMKSYQGEKAIPVIIKHAQNEIKGWQRLIDYWNKEE